MERSAWTDERLDDRFDRIDGELVDLRSEVRELRREMRQGFAELRGEMADMRSTTMRLYGAQLAATFGLIAAILIRGG